MRSSSRLKEKDKEAQKASKMRRLQSKGEIGSKTKNLLKVRKL